MHEIDGQGATQDHRFTEGDPAGGVAPTIMTATFANAVMDEICNVVRAADMELDKETNTQLRDAILELAAVRLQPNGGIIDTDEGLAVDPSKIDATAQLRYNGLI